MYTHVCNFNSGLTRCSTTSITLSCYTYANYWQEHPSTFVQHDIISLPHYVGHGTIDNYMHNSCYTLSLKLDDQELSVKTGLSSPAMEFTEQENSPV